MKEKRKLLEMEASEKRHKKMASNYKVTKNEMSKRKKKKRKISSGSIDEEWSEIDCADRKEGNRKGNKKKKKRPVLKAREGGYGWYGVKNGPPLCWPLLVTLMQFMRGSVLVDVLREKEKKREMLPWTWSNFSPSFSSFLSFLPGLTHRPPVSGRGAQPHGDSVGRHAWLERWLVTLLCGGLTRQHKLFMLTSSSSSSQTFLSFLFFGRTRPNGLVYNARLLKHFGSLQYLWPTVDGHKKRNTMWRQRNRTWLEKYGK